VIEKKSKQKTIYNEHQTTIDLQDYQAVTCVWFTNETVNNVLRLQKSKCYSGHRASMYNEILQEMKNASNARNDSAPATTTPDDGGNDVTIHRVTVT